MKSILGTLSLSFIALLLGVVPNAANAETAGVVESIKGEARANDRTLGPSHWVDNQDTVTTGPGARLTLHMNDGQQLILDQNTEVRITDFQYRAADPKADRAVFGLVKGALRVVSGAIARRNGAAFALRVPQATIVVRGGADFMVALVNPAYLAVLEGSVSAANTAGMAIFGSGVFGYVSSSTAAPKVVPASTFSAAATAAFANLSGGTLLGAAGLGVEGGAVQGAGPATGAAQPMSTGAMVAIGAAVAAGIAAASRSGSSSTTSHNP